MSQGCEFCVDRVEDDILYESSSWDGGIGFDYVYIKYCPICGRKLDKYDRFIRNNFNPSNETINEARKD